MRCAQERAALSPDGGRRGAGLRAASSSRRHRTPSLAEGHRPGPRRIAARPPRHGGLQARIAGRRTQCRTRPFAPPAPRLRDRMRWAGGRVTPAGGGGGRRRGMAVVCRPECHHTHIHIHIHSPPPPPPPRRAACRRAATAQNYNTSSNGVVLDRRERRPAGGIQGRRGTLIYLPHAAPPCGHSWANAVIAAANPPPRAVLAAPTCMCGRSFHDRERQGRRKAGCHRAGR